MSNPAKLRRRSKTPSIEEIRAAAAEFFYEKGFRATSMQDLADVLGIAKPTLYAHVSNKNSLLVGIFDEMIALSDNALAGIGSNDDAVEGLRHVVRSWTRLAMDKPAHMRVFHGDHRELPEEVQRKYAQWARGVYADLRDLIRAGQKAGQFRSELDPTPVAFAVFSSVQWMPRWLSAEGRLTPDDVAEQYCMLFTDGLVSHEGKSV